jgi:hypothetical protein
MLETLVHLRLEVDGSSCLRSRDRTSCFDSMYRRHVSTMARGGPLTPGDAGDDDAGDQAQARRHDGAPESDRHHSQHIRLLAEGVIDLLSSHHGPGA